MRIPSYILCAGCLLLLVGALQARAQSTEPGTEARSSEVVAHDGRNILIGPEDTINILAANAEEISKSWRVGTSGYLNLPMVGRLRAGGLTVEQLEVELVERLKEFIIEPQVIVYVAEFRSQPVTVTGAVEKPGITQIQGTKGLFDVIMRAGGPKDPGPTVTVTRNLERGRIPYPGAQEREGTSVVELDTKEVMQGRGPAANLAIESGDVIAVSEVKEQKLVHIVGEVNKPGAVELVTQDTVSLLKVVAAAGGLTRLASAKKTLIRHVSTDGVHTETAMVNLKDIMSGKANDLKLAPGDIVIVPSSQLMTYMQTAYQSALTTGIFVLARF